MSGSRPSVGIRISAEGADLARQKLENIGTTGDAAMRRVAGASTAARPAIQGVAGAADGVQRSIVGLNGNLSLLASGFAGAAAAGTAMGVALVGGFTASVRAAEQFERLGLRTEAVIKATGGAAGLSAQQIREMSQELARGTLASTAGVEAAAQKLLTFRSIAGDAFGRTLRAAQDLAAVGFGSIDSAATQLGKALESPVTGMSALAEVGVSFTAAQKEVVAQLVATGRAAEAQAIILAAVEQQVGGAGGAEAGGLAGAYDTLAQNTEEFLLAIGNRGPIQLATVSLQALAGVVKELNELVTSRSGAAAARAGVTAAESALAAAEKAQTRRGFLGGALSLGEGAREIERARAALREAKQEEEQILVDAYARQAALAAKSAIEQAGIQRAASAAAVRALELESNKKEHIQEKFRQKRAVIDEAERTGARTAEEAAALRSTSNQQEIEELDKLAGAQAGVAAATRGRGDAAKEAQAVERAANKEAAAAVKAVQKVQEEARAKALSEVDRFNREVESQSRRVADDVATNLFEAMTGDGKGESVVDFFKNIFKRIAIQALSANIILPITTAIIGGAPGLFGINAPGQAGGGGVGGIGDILGLGNLTSGLSSLGSYQLISPGGGYISPIGEAGAPIGGLTLGGLAGSAALGFGVGGLTAGLTGGNSLGGGLGGALGGAGASALAAIPLIAAALGPLAPFAPLLGAVLGGGLGGLVGPKPSVKGFSFRLQSEGFEENGRNEFGDTLNPVSRKYFNESGAAAFQQADTLVAAVNAYLGQRGLQVGGVSVVSGNKNGPDGKGFGNLSDAFENLRFRSKDDTGLSASLAGKTFDDPAKLQAFVDGFLSIQATIKSLTAEAVPAFTVSISAVNDNFAAVRAEATRLGVSMDGLAEAQLRANTELEAARTEALRSSSVNLEIRRLAAVGFTEGAELLRQAEAASAEVTAFGRALDALAITAEDKANRLVQLEEVQAAERANIVTRYGEQANAALRQQQDAMARDVAGAQGLLRELAFGASSALAPEQQYFGALSTLNSARRDLDAGGSLSDYTAVASQVLPVARQFLGTSTRYAGLAAEVGQVLSSRGGDTAGLSAILSAQVDGIGSMETTFAAFGERQLSVANLTLTEIRRLASVLEAMISRQQAA